MLTQQKYIRTISKSNILLLYIETLRSLFAKMSICYCLFGAFSTASFFSVQIKEREQFKATTAMFLLVWVTLATFYFISSDTLLKWFLDSA